MDAISFECPGCGSTHLVTINGSRNASNATWGFDGNFDSPTITPSINASSEWDDHSALTDEDYGPWVPSADGKSRGREVKPSSRHKLVHHVYRCHSFVRAGMIQFLGDCTHKLANHTVPLPDL